MLGLIGTGFLARKQHLPNMLRLPNVELRTICDRDSQLLEQCRQTFKVSVATTDHRALLADPEIQGVVIATKEDVQAALTIEALRAGKHVYVEKPLANTVQECQAVAEAQQRADRFVAVGFNRRFAPAYVKAKELIKDNGGAYNIRYRLSDGMHLWKSHGGPQYERAAGTRVIYELCHIFDLLRWLCDADVESVYCIQSRMDDEVYAMKMTSGCVASLMHTSYTTIDMPKEHLEVVMERGGLTVDNFVELRSFGDANGPAAYHFPGHTHPQYFGYADAYPELILKDGGLAGNVSEPFSDMMEMIVHLTTFNDFAQYRFDKGWLHAMAAFAEGILSGHHAQHATAADSVYASRVAHAAIESRETGSAVQVVTVPDEFSSRPQASKASIL